MAKGLYINPKEFKSFNELELDREIATRTIADGSLSGWFNELPDPDPILRKLGMDITVYKDLLSDDQVGSDVIRRKNGVKSLDFQILQGDEASEKEVALCEAALKNLTKSDGKRKNKIKDIIDQSCNPILWGFSIFEITWEKTNSQTWLPRHIEEKPQEWFYFDEDNVLWFKPVNYSEAFRLDDPKYRYKFILLQNSPTYQNPYGDKALSRCFWPVTFKRGGLKFYSVFVEKYGMPHITGKQPRGAGPEAAADLLAKLNRMVQDAVAVIPDDSSVTVEQTGQKASADIYNSFINLNNKAIDKAILTNTLSTEQVDKGGYSSSSTGTEIEERLSRQDRDFPEELFNEVFKYVIDINLGTGKYPVFGTYEEDEINNELAERDEKLSAQVKFKKNYFVRKYNLKEDEFDLLNDKPGEQAANRNTEFAASKDTEDELLPAEILQLQMEPVLKPVFELAAASASYDELMKKLASVYPDMDANLLQSTLQKVIFIKNIQGRIEEAARSQ
jgi:phage gp29-like protein